MSATAITVFVIACGRHGAGSIVRDKKSGQDARLYLCAAKDCDYTVQASGGRPIAPDVREWLDGDEATA